MPTPTIPDSANEPWPAGPGRRERTSTVWFSDAVNYSGLSERGADSARRAVRRHVSQQVVQIRTHGGRIVSVAGDGVMAEFADPGAALACARRVQQATVELNADAPPGEQMRFRIGLASGPVTVDVNPESGSEELFGATVIVAARLEQAAEPGAINLSDALRADAERLGLPLFDLGFRKLKGIDGAVRVHRIALPGDEMRAASEGGEAPAPSADPRRARSIAVLRFSARGDDDAAYFAEGVAEDIVGALSRSHWLFVTSARSSFALTDAGLEQRQIADRLNVRYLVDGSVRRGGSRLRVAVRLIDADADVVVWSETFDRAGEDLFALQDQIASGVAACLEPAFLRHEEAVASRVEPRDLRQWDLLMRARWHFWRAGRRHAVAALETARNALALDDRNAEVHAFLSFVEMTWLWSGLSPDPKAGLKAALHHAHRAVELDDTNANARFTLGTTLSCVGRLDEALAEERQALVLNPHFAAARGETGRLLAFQGDAQGARVHLMEAERLSPIDPTISLWRRSAAIAAFTENDLDGAVARQTEAVAARPDWFFHHYLHAGLLGVADRLDEARAALAEGRKRQPSYSADVMRVGHPFADPAHFERLLSGLRAAGWSDG